MTIAAYHNLSTKRIDDIIREVSAKEILPRWKQLQDHEIKTKTGPSDLVTDADIQAEKALTEIFEKEFPGCVVIGEEAVSRGDVDMQSILKDPPEVLFIIDPMDGTWNFAHGSEVFACMVACLYKGETVMSWIYDITKDTSAIAEKGQGSFYGDEKLKARPTKLRSEIDGYIGLSFIPELIRPQIEENIQKVNSVTTLRCAGHEYLRLARGKMDFAIFSRTEPWDHMAGILLLQEAGGVSQRYDEAPYQLTSRRQVLLNASTPEVWDDMHDLFIHPVLSKIDAR